MNPIPIAVLPAGMKDFSYRKILSLTQKNPIIAISKTHCVRYSFLRWALHFWDGVGCAGAG